MRSNTGQAWGKGSTPRAGREHEERVEEAVAVRRREVAQLQTANSKNSKTPKTANTKRQTANSKQQTANSKPQTTNPKRQPRAARP